MFKYEIKIKVVLNIYFSSVLHFKLFCNVLFEKKNRKEKVLAPHFAPFNPRLQYVIIIN
jgi:hypothetical protein